MPGSGAFVRFAFTNFGAFLLDTKDLSVIRGASALLDDTASSLPQRLQGQGAPPFETVYARASEALFWVASVPDAETLRRAVEASASQAGRDARPTFATATRAWRPDEALADALRGLEAQLRAEQMRRSTVVPDTATASDPCVLDGVRPASTSIARGGEAQRVSAATAERFARGRRLRIGLLRRIFPDAAPLDEREVEADFDALARFHAPIPGFPHSHGWTRPVPRPVRGKMCVVHGDGNGFGACRARLASIDGLRLFARLVDEALREALRGALQPLWIRADAAGAVPFHVLAWAGDEWTVVLPAGFGALAVRDLGTAFRDALGRGLREAAGPGADEVRAATRGALTLTLGAVFCDAHEPIERASALARALVEEAKAAGVRGHEHDPALGNVVDFAVVESGFVPSTVDGLAGRRPATASDAARRRPLTLDGYAKLVHDVEALKRAEFPNTRVHAVARLAAQPPPPPSPQRARDAARQPRSLAEELERVTPLVKAAAVASGVRLDDAAAWLDRREIWDYVGC